MAQLILGTELSKTIRADLIAKIESLEQQGKRIPGLAVILVGEDPASVSYVTNKEKACRQIGINSTVLRFKETIREEELIRTIHDLNKDDRVDGILVQLPLPKHIDKDRIIGQIAVEKDVDGFHPLNIAKLQLQQDGFVPCTPYGIMEMLKSIHCVLSGQHAVIIGRSNLVGRPLIQLLLNENATVTICHSKTRDLPSIAKQADVLIVAIGQMGLVTAEFVKENAVVIDVGINRGKDGKLHGDVDFESVEPVASYITPVPRGVGPMTITMLLKNTLKAYDMREKRHGI